MLAVPTLPTDTPPRTVVSLNPRPQWATGEGPEDRVQSRALTGRDFLTGTSFALTGGSAEAGGYAALWGRGAISRFDGQRGRPHPRRRGRHRADGRGLSDTSRDYRLGWRLTSARPGDPGFEIGLDATRREALGADAEHVVMLRGTIRW